MRQTHEPRTHSHSSSAQVCRGAWYVQAHARSGANVYGEAERWLATRWLTRIVAKIAQWRLIRWQTCAQAFVGVFVHRARHRHAQISALQTPDLLGCVAQLHGRFTGRGRTTANTQPCCCTGPSA